MRRRDPVRRRGAPWWQRGIFVAKQIAGHNPPPIIESGIPRATYCEPQIGSVGLTEAQAREQYGADRVGIPEYDLAGNATIQMLQTGGLIELVGEKDGGPIVGVRCSAPGSVCSPARAR